MRKLLCLVLLAGLLHTACGRAEFTFSDDGGADSKTRAPLGDFARNPYLSAPDAGWPYPVPRSVLEDPLDVLRLINRENLLDKAYPDQGIDMYRLAEVTLPATKNEEHLLRPIVHDALAALFAGAAAEGFTLYVGSSYRSYRDQEVIHYNRVKRMGRDDGVSQMAGASEHQAGLAADVVSRAYRDKFQQAFGDTDEGKWLAANCARYGFILRYPKDKTEITGVPYEPWHVRYVGVEAAAYIMASGLTLEEFTEEWRREVAGYQ